MKQVLAVIGGLIAATVLIVAIAIGGQELGLWMEEKQTNRRTDIANDSLARQQALLDSTQDKYRTATDIDVQLSTATPEQAKPLRAQRKAVVSQFCDDYVLLTNNLTIPTNMASFASQECI